MEPGATVTVRAAAEALGAKPATIRAAVRRGAILKLGERPTGPWGRGHWLLDFSSVMAWHRRSGRPGPVPADPLQLALDGSLVVALDRALWLAAVRRLEDERARLVAERRRIAAARAALLARSRA